MNKKFLIASILLITVGLVLISNAIAQAQSQNEFTVPLTDPAKRGKLNAHLNYGSITVKGTARKDILVKYASAEEDEEEDRKNGHLNIKLNKKLNNDRDDDDGEESRAGLKRIGGGGMDLEVTENNNQVKVHSNSWHHRLNLEIEVPSGTDL